MADWLTSDLLKLYPKTKIPVTIRLDADIKSFFQEYGPGYQTRINAVLRAFMEHEQAKQRAT